MGQGQINNLNDFRCGRWLAFDTKTLEDYGLNNGGVYMPL